MWGLMSCPWPICLHLCLECTHSIWQFSNWANSSTPLSFFLPPLSWKSSALPLKSAPIPCLSAKFSAFWGNAIQNRSQMVAHSRSNKRHNVATFGLMHHCMIIDTWMLWAFCHYGHWSNCNCAILHGIIMKRLKWAELRTFLDTY